MPKPFAQRHLLDIESLSTEEITDLLDLAETYVSDTGDKKRSEKLRGRTVVNLFFEPSTRTRTSFEIAAKRMGGEIVNIAIEHSSTKKGESLRDTVLNLDAMGIDALVVRHAESGVPRTIASEMKASVINAGDGTNEHPTQALLDALVIKRHKKTLSGLKVAYCGDYIRSRVANSFIHLMTKLGSTVRVAAPADFLTDKFAHLGVETTDNIETALKDADVVMTQRIQLERMSEGQFAMSLKDYHQRYGLDHQKLKAAKADVIVLNPGPVIREVEITSKLADDPVYSVIREQVAMGVAVRMAVLDRLLSR